MALTRKQQEQQWQAEDDARTMANYQELMRDKQRVARAVKVAKQRASELNKQATAMTKVANTKTKASASSANRKTTTRKRK